MSNDPARDQVLRRVSRETGQKLELYVDELKRWQTIKNLVGPSTLEHIWSRHIADCLQLLDIVPEPNRWVDLGSGAGLPGLVIAIAGAEGTKVHLVESNGRKAAFLRDVARKTGANAVIHASRLQDALPKLVDDADLVSARALAPLTDLLAWCDPLWRNRVIGLFMKGQDVEAELTEASKSWMIQYDLIPSQTDDKARIVRINSVSPRRS